MKSKPGDKQRLLHILDAISEIENYTKDKTLNDFLNNSMMRFASIKQIEIIGEAASFMTRGTKAKFDEIEWSQIAGMRHILVHEYFGVDDNIVWQVIINDIPVLKQKVQKILSELES
jgi:uncharacterized protein with HEPN domain